MIGIPFLFGVTMALGAYCSQIVRSSGISGAGGGGGGVGGGLFLILRYRPFSCRPSHAASRNSLWKNSKMGLAIRAIR